MLQSSNHPDYCKLSVNQTIAGTEVSPESTPSSAPFILIYSERLCEAVISRQQVRGFLLGDSEVQLLAYADDLALVCRVRQSVVIAFPSFPISVKRRVYSNKTIRTLVRGVVCGGQHRTATRA